LLQNKVVAVKKYVYFAEQKSPKLGLAYKRCATAGGAGKEPGVGRGGKRRRKHQAPRGGGFEDSQEEFSGWGCG